jgi:hypothetical protein
METHRIELTPEQKGILHASDNGKPQGVGGVTVRGAPISATVLDARR